MPYIHGDNFYYCDTCGRKLEINMFMSVPFYDLKREGWEYYVEQVNNIIPGKMIYSQYTGGRWVKTKTKTRNVIYIKCDTCVLIGERINKIKNIKERLNG